MPYPQVIMLFVLIALLGACGNTDSTAKASAHNGATIAAGGLVEPAGEERIVTPELTGHIAKVFVNEGDVVKAGQVLAELENADYRAALASADAQIKLHTAELDKIKNGARKEELDQAKAARDQTVAQEQLAAAELKRHESIAAKKLISVTELDQARAQLSVTRAQREQTQASLALLEAGSRKEDIAAGEAALAAASAERDHAKALLDKTFIRSPIDGVMLNRTLNEGETVIALSPQPLARIGDMSRLFVRADVDELDVSRVQVGAKATVSSDAFPGQRFAGHVTYVSQRMGKRNLRSDNPAEKRDIKILEALIELDGHPPLPVGLHVDVRIDTASGPVHLNN